MYLYICLYILVYVYIDRSVVYNMAVLGHFAPWNIFIHEVIIHFVTWDTFVLGGIRTFYPLYVLGHFRPYIKFSSVKLF